MNKFRFDRVGKGFTHRLEIESGRWQTPESIPFQERKCHDCNVFRMNIGFY